MHICLLDVKVCGNVTISDTQADVQMYIYGFIIGRD